MRLVLSRTYKPKPNQRLFQVTLLITPIEKMNKYQELLYIANHTETNETLAIYRDKYSKIYARPKEMFFGNVAIKDAFVPQFKEIA